MNRLNSAMRCHLAYDQSSTIVKTGDNVRRLVADEDRGTVLYTDTSTTIASVEDPHGFEGYQLGAWDLQEAWDNVAQELTRQLGKQLVADLFEVPQVVLLVEE